MFTNKLFLSLLVAVILLSGCAPQTTTNEPSPSTPMQSPTETLLPTIAVDTLTTGQHPYTFRSSSGKEVRFLLYLPENYDPDKEWPLMMFLHGIEERGMDIDLVKLEHTPPKLLETDPNFPFIVISPQLPPELFWEDYIDPLNELLTQLEETLSVDSNRLYLTGLSMGGFGVWSYALQYPDRFAAIAPIAGGHIYQSEEVPDDICKLNQLPIWVFHGGGDTMVEPYHSQILVDALITCGSDVKFTLYPNVEHDIAWVNAYADPALYEWFLAHTR